ncbi:MAG: penicillin-binding transpeptidase domain-containing protein [Mycobacteriales bacterium]
MVGTGVGGLSRRRRRRWRGPVAIGLVLVVIAAVVITVVEVKAARDRAAKRSQAQAVSVTTRFLAAWGRQDAAAMAGLATPDTAPYVRSEIPKLRASLFITSASYVHGPVSSTSRPGAPFTAKVVVQGLGTWSYSSRLHLQKVDGSWAVDFTPATIYPTLTAADTIVRTRDEGRRGVLTTTSGTPIRGASAEIDGNLLGTVGTYDAAQAKAAGPLFEKGDKGGLNGLERAYNSTLSGTPGGSLTIRDAGGTTVTTLLSSPKTDGRNVALSIDLPTQRAAEAAVTAAIPAGQIGSLVAIDVATGKVLALANHPVNGYGYAVRGQFPAGSTFKIITTTAAIMNGKTASTVLPCEPAATIDGRVFKNAENESYGPLSLAQAFAKSCNTAYVTLSSQIPTGSITKAAELYGMSAAPLSQQAGPLPISSHGGSVPLPSDGADQAAESIGQGRVLVSPLEMASVAAAIAAGTWRQPYVTAAPPPGEKTTALPAAVVSNLRDFTGLVVTSGTAAHSGLPAGTHGKTGTAEYGTANPPKTIAWFVGYQGGIAFACQVGGAGVNAGFGADTAAPVVANFLRRL